MEQGWIKLYRKIRDSKLWKRPRRYSWAEAWIDLLMAAAHADHQVIRDYGTMTVKRGQVLTSQLALAKRWRWHRESVMKFLRFQNTDSAIDIETSNKTSTGYTLITIRNYEKYQGSDSDETDSQLFPHTDSQTSTRPTVARQSPDTIKNGEEWKEGEPRLQNGLGATLRATTHLQILASPQHARLWTMLLQTVKPYPAVILADEIGKADRYLETHPEKRGKRIPSFMSGWIDRAIADVKAQQRQSAGPQYRDL